MVCRCWGAGQGRGVCRVVGGGVVLTGGRFAGGGGGGKVVSGVGRWESSEPRWVDLMWVLWCLFVVATGFG